MVRSTSLMIEVWITSWIILCFLQRQIKIVEFKEKVHQMSCLNHVLNGDSIASNAQNAFVGYSLFLFDIFQVRSSHFHTQFSFGQKLFLQPMSCKIFKGVDREKSAVFKELTQNFRTYELRGQAKKKKKKKKF